MVKDLFGSKTAEGVILFLSYVGHGHTRGIASKTGLTTSQVDRTLKRLEAGGIVVGKFIGRTRQYEINPRLPYKNELLALVDRIVALMPEEERGRYIERRRPRRTGKKL